jgi:hypothetical protein
LQVVFGFYFYFFYPTVGFLCCVLFLSLLKPCTFWLGSCSCLEEMLQLDFYDWLCSLFSNQGEEENEWKCKGSLDLKEVFYEYFIQSKLKWMLVEANALWLRNYRNRNWQTPFYYCYCKVTKANKNVLGHHRKMNKCPECSY